MPRPDLKRAIVAAIVVSFGAATAARAQSYSASGQIGYLHEWEITGNLAKTVTSPGTEYSGTITLRHVGLCSVNGAEQKQASMQLKVSYGRLEGILIMDQDQCRIVASGSAGAGLLRCGSGQDVPINLLIGKAVETEAADRARF
ncbi:hypothetical protein [Bradyrhizobium sp. Gha]|uniref:hypothetical protein n=1 Tax=Bradyrhizobium sp. Gha TaxID=1855318 RepID=UPI0008E92724|nr:hypothetical protein [Bradyrhizobium sp. Gha]SFJ60950.1 hypothetical protein SAMN05216525_12997 [Bradyrhizobium sp. Gha]